MKRENGLGMILMIIIVIIICLVAAVTIYFYFNRKSDIRDNSVKSDMLLIQGACKVNYESNVMKKTTDELIGTKLSETDDNEDIDKDVINGFKEKQVVKEDDYDKYYVLTNKDLKELKLEVTNREGAYYLIGYEKEDVIITSGYNGKYHLSELETEETEDSSEQEEKSDSEDKEKEESEEEEDKEDNEEEKEDDE